MTEEPHTLAQRQLTRFESYSICGAKQQKLKLHYEACMIGVTLSRYRSTMSWPQKAHTDIVGGMEEVEEEEGEYLSSSKISSGPDEPWQKGRKNPTCETSYPHIFSFWNCVPLRTRVLRFVISTFCSYTYKLFSLYHATVREWPLKHLLCRRKSLHAVAAEWKQPRPVPRLPPTW